MRFVRPKHVALTERQRRTRSNETHASGVLGICSCRATSFTIPRTKPPPRPSETTTARPSLEPHLPARSETVVRHHSYTRKAKFLQAQLPQESQRRATPTTTRPFSEPHLAQKTQPPQRHSYNRMETILTSAHHTRRATSFAIPETLPQPQVVLTSATHSSITTRAIWTPLAQTPP